MTDVAALAGVAKATLYNHFRTRDEVFSALVVAEVEEIAAECAGRPLTDALGHAAARLSGHRGLRQVAADDPGALVRLATGGDAPGWQAARSAVRAALQAEGLTGDDVVLRWLSSYLATPGGAESAREGAVVLVAGLAGSQRAERDLPAVGDRC